MAFNQQGALWNLGSTHGKAMVAPEAGKTWRHWIEHAPEELRALGSGASVRDIPILPFHGPRPVPNVSLISPRYARKEPHDDSPLWQRLQRDVVQPPSPSPRHQPPETRKVSRLATTSWEFEAPAAPVEEPPVHPIGAHFESWMQQQRIFEPAPRDHGRLTFEKCMAREGTTTGAPAILADLPGMRTAVNGEAASPRSYYGLQKTDLGMEPSTVSPFGASPEKTKKQSDVRKEGISINHVHIGRPYRPDYDPGNIGYGRSDLGLTQESPRPRQLAAEQRFASGTNRRIESDIQYYHNPLKVTDLRRCAGSRVAHPPPALQHANRANANGSRTQYVRRRVFEGQGPATEQVPDGPGKWAKSSTDLSDVTYWDRPYLDAIELEAFHAPPPSCGRRTTDVQPPSHRGKR